MPEMDNDSFYGNDSYFEEYFDMEDEPFRENFTFGVSLIMTTFCVIGAIGNLISAFVFTRRSMQSSINVLLTGLSFVDLFLLITAIPVFAVPGLNAFGHFGDLPQLQMAIVFGLYQCAVIGQTCSAWTFVLITIERYFAVCHPLRVQRLFTVRRAKITLLTVITLSILYNVCRFWEYRKITDVNGTIGYGRHLRADPHYFVGYYTVSYLFVHFFIPFSLIAALNARIAKTVVVASSIRLRLTSSAPGNLGGRQRQITRMIVVVTAIFAICNVLPFCQNIWEAASPSAFHFYEDGHELDKFVAYVIQEISNLLVVVNSSINFFIYFVYCKKYRRIVARVCLPERIGAKRGREYMSEANRTQQSKRLTENRQYSLSGISITAVRVFQRMTTISNSASTNSF